MRKEHKLKYDKAWDNKLKRYITPDNVNEVERHDRNRYFSEKFEDNEDKGEVLTLHKQSKTFKNKNGTEVSRKSHFASIGKNTKDYREKTDTLIKKQESLIHKLCKEVIKEIKYIKVPSVKANIMDVEYTIIHEQVLKIEFKHTEKMDKLSKRIPDAVITANLLGCEQEINLEFLYSHAVDENKRRQYEYYRQNCLELDISYLRDNLEDSEKSLRNKIKLAIENECYWAVNKTKLLCENEAFNMHIIEISKHNGLLTDSFYYPDNTYKRLFIYKDKLKDIDENHPCYFVEKPNLKYTQDTKCTDIGTCNNCNNCVFITNYYDKNTNNIKIYCNKIGDGQRINPFKVVNDIIADAIKLSAIKN